MEIKSTLNAVFNGVKVLLYGASGVGKTTTIATAEAPLILSSEEGELSLASHDIPVITIKSIRDLCAAYDWVAGSDESKKYKTIALDSLTDIAENGLLAAKKLFKDPRQAYGEVNDIMLTTIKKFIGLKDKHIYFVALETGSDDGAVSAPLMPGRNLGRRLPGLFDELFHMRIGLNEDGDVIRYIVTESDGTCLAKDRSGVLEVQEKPDLRYIFNKIVTGIEAKKSSNTKKKGKQDKKESKNGLFTELKEGKGNA